uniref:Uncharacterized protein n=1 Tax=Plectus sambesii TaxID=2011161 RepID=A0A914WJC9_9BILA
MAAEWMEKTVCFLQQNKQVMALKDLGEQLLAKSPEPVRMRGWKILDTVLLFTQRVVVAMLVLLGRDLQHPTEKPAGFIGFIPTVVRLLRNSYYLMKLVRKWIGNTRELETPKPMGAARNMTSQLHSTPKYSEVVRSPPKNRGAGEKTTPVREDASSPQARDVSRGAASPDVKSPAARDSPDCAASTSMAGLSSLAGWLFNGVSGYVDDNDADNNEAGKTSGDESQEFRSVTDSDAVRY